MYFNALQKGLSVLPEADEAMRQRLEEEARVHGLEALHQRLTEIDPNTAKRIHAHDAQRIQRALEVYYLTGTTLSEFLAQQKSEIKYRFINFVLFPEQRAWLHQRIAQRFEQMLDGGLVAEVQGLLEKWELSMNLPSMRCVGYRQVLEYMQGDYDKVALREKGIAATRQLAKRQLTWLRHWDDALFYDSQNKTFNEQIIAKTREILDNEAS